MQCCEESDVLHKVNRTDGVRITFTDYCFRGKAISTRARGRVHERTGM